MTYSTDMSGRYTPLYYLSAVGAGGLAVSFFMYLMWLTPHPGSPIATQASIAAAWASADWAMSALILVALAGIAYFVLQHVRLLVWNLRHASRWKQTTAYDAFRSTNAETQLMAEPLAVAMTINASFIAGAVFVPGLWELREWLFPLAIAAFAAVGVWAMRILLAFFGRVFAKGGFDCSKNNSLGQMLSVFAVAMVGVGFSASAAMSHVKPTVVVAYLGAVFFLAAAILLGLVMLVLGFRSMMENGAGEETTPTLWIMIPILTVVGIGLYRLKMSMAHNFSVPTAAAEGFPLLATIIALQAFFGLLGYAVMRRVRYFERWVIGPERSVGAYALVCPGVALTVSGFFLLNAGLVKMGVLDVYSPMHLALHLPLVALQVATIALFVRLNGKLLADMPAKPAATLPRAA